MLPSLQWEGTGVTMQFQYISLLIGGRDHVQPCHKHILTSRGGLLPNTGAYVLDCRRDKIRARTITIFSLLLIVGRLANKRQVDRLNFSRVLVCFEESSLQTSNLEETLAVLHRGA